ncbi:tRNA1Val (adenine37-N6)-methyltransferase [Tangfeifania diversioriginum]|uniref:tRNA1(Val) (adenine(37)-N6)-methyltransferase n=1 Tax=Tangfeifania diversioriginum TaxID=1168035 RepID=A0A1M6GNG6_9BACT|nr:methyltransferase [Tangfeifania diversioriginum]SHJ11459.1 tRNA1Val (adenine37-N6)-methyltransferase [Tangfeifania diversioriginum]
MAHNTWFQFKQFKIIQEKAAMKVGTDGVLLGAWVNISEARTILDVGTGTGIIALMLAQRSQAKITGIEIEENAAAEATENARNSPWSNRISILHTSFQEFAATSQNQFDCIVSNPPYFANNIKSADKNLAVARHSDLLSFSDLAKAAKKLLTTNGKLALILPADNAPKFIETAKCSDLFLSFLTEVKPTPQKPANRWLMEFTQKPQPPEKTSLSIRNDDGKDFSPQYKMLTHNFYLKF